MRAYACPTKRPGWTTCPVLTRGDWALLEHLRLDHGMRGCTLYARERRLVWEKTGEEFPLVLVDDEDLRQSYEARAMDMMLGALSQPRRDLRGVDAQVREMGFRGGLL
ncbi:MAG: hypothetical protein Q8R28_10695 [Dehalococcoidia bacterium]|nr:hypothetical protein [Dehalococcoidia bacterium]